MNSKTLLAILLLLFAIALFSFSIPAYEVWMKTIEIEAIKSHIDIETVRINKIIAAFDGDKQLALEYIIACSQAHQPC